MTHQPHATPPPPAPYRSVVRSYKLVENERRKTDSVCIMRSPETHDPQLKVAHLCQHKENSPGMELNTETKTTGSKQHIQPHACIP